MTNSADQDQLASPHRASQRVHNVETTSFQRCLPAGMLKTNERQEDQLPIPNGGIHYVRQDPLNTHYENTPIQIY